MVSKPNENSLVILCLALSAAMFFFGTGLSPAWPVIWLAPIPVLWLAPRLPASSAFLVAAAAFALGGLNEWYYLTIIVPLWLSILNSLGPACIFGLAVLLFRSRMLKGRVVQAALIVPAFWVAYEFISASVSVHGTIGNLGYSQIKFLPILQLAAVTGIWGISFSIFTFAAAVAAFFSTDSPKQKRALAIGLAVFLAGVFGYGYWRLASTPKNSPTIKVGLIASDDSMNLIVPTTQDAAYAFDRFGKQMLSMSAEGIQLFVLPEHSGPVTDASVSATDATFEQLARQTHAFIAVGVDRITPKVSWNQERLYAPDGTLLATYNKHHLLPHWEDQFTPATDRTSLSVPYGAMCEGPDAKQSMERSAVPAASGRWGLEICKDMDFPLLSRQYARDGVALMVVPAWDFFLDGWSHGSMAIMRGVEGGFSVARSAKRSVLYASDDRGRVIAQHDTLFAPFATVIATVPVRHDVTLYAKFGDWFGWLNLGLLAVLLGMPLIARH
jgi:apolipoprotein N-acyltransferase